MLLLLRRCGGLFDIHHPAWLWKEERETEGGEEERKQVCHGEGGEGVRERERAGQRRRDGLWQVCSALLPVPLIG